MTSRRRFLWFSLSLTLAVAVSLPASAADWVEIVRVRPASGVIHGVTTGEVSHHPGEYLEITVRYNLESDCPVTGGAGFLSGYWGIGDVDPGSLQFDILPGPDSVIQELLPRTGRGQRKFRWSFQCHPGAPPVIDGYIWNLGASLACSSGELDFVEPLLGLDYWTIACP